MLIVVSTDGTVFVRQFESSSECKSEWLIARSIGLDAYYYLMPTKTKSTAIYEGITEVII